MTAVTEANARIQVKELLAVPLKITIFKQRRTLLSPNDRMAIYDSFYNLDFRRWRTVYLLSFITVSDENTDTVDPDSLRPLNIERKGKNKVDDRNVSSSLKCLLCNNL